ncbi:MAG: hypothetical protein ACOX9C_12960 [Kiritimatiellia bacterium]|jgi:opacity protein-like surface antigen
MSKSTWIAAAGIAAIMTSVSFAVTPSSRATGNLDFGLFEQDLSRWHLAVYGAGATRNLESKSGAVVEMDHTRFNVIVGYDISRWISLYGLAGVAKLSEDTPWGDNDDTVAVWGAGLWANLIQTELLPPMDTMTSFRLTSGLEASFSDFDEGAWLQVDGHLTFGIMNELHAFSHIFPEMIGVFAGPVFSYVDLEGYDSDSDNLFGLTVGLDVIFNRKVYAVGGADLFDDDTVAYGMVGVRF